MQYTLQSAEPMGPILADGYRMTRRAIAIMFATLKRLVRA